MIQKESDISTRVQELLGQEQTRRQVIVGGARNAIKGGLLIGGTASIVEATFPMTLEVIDIFKYIKLQRQDWENADVSNEEFVRANRQKLEGVPVGTTVAPERYAGTFGLANTHENEDNHSRAKEELDTITDDWENGGLGMKEVRFSVRWSSVTEDDGEHNFTRYDPLFDILVDREIDIILETGVKSAGWKEDWIPGAVLRKYGTPPPNSIIQAGSLISNECVRFVGILGQHLLDRYGQRIVDRVIGIKPENEPFQQFGEGGYTMSFGHLWNLTQEFRKFFPNARVSVNTAPYTNLELIKDYFDYLRKDKGEDLGMWDTDFDLYPHHPDIPRILGFKPDQLTLASVAPGYSYSDHLEFSKKVGSGVGIMELQDEPWDPEMMPGNSARFARYAFLRALRLRIPGRPFKVREWGAQRHAQFKLGDREVERRGSKNIKPSFTAEHHEIYDLYHRIRSLQAA